MRTTFVEAPDGVRLAVSDAGPVSDAPSVVFVHGIAQSRHSWAPLFAGDLARRFRLVALDLRGHGDSDKPEGDAPYTDGVRFAEDLEAVIRELKLERPVVAAWSYGGVVVGDYLRHRGDGALGGLFLVAASMKTGKPARALFGPGMLANGRGLMADTEEIYMATARAFLQSCSARPVPEALVDESLRAMLRVPPHVRRALLARTEDYSVELARCTRPVTTLHGELDQIVLPAMSADVVAGLVPSARCVRISDVGHLPFIEAPTHFEAALSEFVARCQG